MTQDDDELRGSREIDIILDGKDEKGALVGVTSVIYMVFLYVV